MQKQLNFGKTRVSITMGDIVDQKVDVIVNAANSTLMGGGGVDGAIHRRGGPRILEECRAIRREHWPEGLPGGEAVITTGGSLPARYVIHTVGPVWRGGNSGEEEILSRCYRNSLELATKEKLRSIAFPSISTGAYGYPIGEASAVALSSIRRFNVERGWPPEVFLVLFSPEDLKVYERKVAELKLEE
jgi:O-acetyl-ADP-ribose deacetylase